MWYESDFFTGLTVGSDTLTAGVTYTSYLSPNGSFGTVQEVSLALSMDDSDPPARTAPAAPWASRSS